MHHPEGDWIMADSHTPEGMSPQLGLGFAGHPRSQQHGTHAGRTASRRLNTSVIRPDKPLPDDLTRRHVLFALYALQEWEWALTSKPDGYAPGFFYNRIGGCVNGITSVSRNNVLRHLQDPTCLACAEPLDLRKTTLDHLMPLR